MLDLASVTLPVEVRIVSFLMWLQLLPVAFLGGSLWSWYFQLLEVSNIASTSVPQLHSWSSKWLLSHQCLASYAFETGWEFPLSFIYCILQVYKAIIICMTPVFAASRTIALDHHCSSLSAGRISMVKLIEGTNSLGILFWTEFTETVISNKRFTIFHAWPFTGWDLANSLRNVFLPQFKVGFVSWC